MKRLLLTGANRGLGRALAEELLRAGSHRLLLVTRSAERRAELAAELGPGCAYLVGDQRSPAFARELCAQLRALGVALDVLFLNAAAMPSGAADAAETRAVLRANFAAPVELLERCLAEGLLRRGARVVLVSSYLGNLRMLRNEAVKARLVAARSVEELAALAEEYAESVARGERWQSRVAVAPEYSFSKLLLSLAARLLAEDRRARDAGVQVLAVCPGWTRTEMGGAGASQSVAQGLAGFRALLELSPRAAEEGRGRLYTQGAFVDLLQRPASA